MDWDLILKISSIVTLVGIFILFAVVAVWNKR